MQGLGETLVVSLLLSDARDLSTAEALGLGGTMSMKGNVQSFLVAEDWKLLCLHPMALGNLR